MAECNFRPVKVGVSHPTVDFEESSPAAQLEAAPKRAEKENDQARAGTEANQQLPSDARPAPGLCTEKG
jgi:hypothetical protein